MQAFHNDPAIKQKYLNRVIAHQSADNLIHGTGWEDGKGCAIGCTLESYDHGLYPIELGIPLMLAKLEDTIFEGLDNGEAQQWPIRFLDAITPGADLSTVGWKFLHWLLTDSKIGAYDHKLVRDAVQQCAAVIEPLTRGEKVDEEAARSAYSAAYSARSAVYSAARSAARSARSAADAADSARSAYSAVYSARSAADSTADSTADSAYSAACSAVYSARSAAHQKMAEKIISLLQEAK